METQENPPPAGTGIFKTSEEEMRGRQTRVQGLGGERKGGPENYSFCLFVLLERRGGVSLGEGLIDAEERTLE